MAPFIFFQGGVKNPFYGLWVEFCITIKTWKLMKAHAWVLCHHQDMKTHMSKGPDTGIMVSMHVIIVWQRFCEPARLRNAHCPCLSCVCHVQHPIFTVSKPLLWAIVLNCVMFMFLNGSYCNSVFWFLSLGTQECVARMKCLYDQWCSKFPVLGRIFYHSSTRKRCQHVLMILYIESIDGQFPIQSATHSFIMR